MFFAYAISDQAVHAARRRLIEADPAAAALTAEDVREALGAAIEHLTFSPAGDNHHNAAACPYCTPRHHQSG